MTMPQPPAPVVVDLWARRVADVPGGHDLLDAHERGTLATFTSATTAMSYAAGHVLARRAVASVVGAPAASLRFERTCSTCGGPHGRPVLTDPDGVHVSLSRCDSWVAVATCADLPVGVDIESIEAVDFPGFAPVAQHPADREARDPGPPRLAQQRAVSWVRKEAALKAVGVGLRADPAGVRTPLSGIPADLLGDGTWVTVQDVPLPWPEAVAAVAVAGRAIPVTIRQH